MKNIKFLLLTFLMTAGSLAQATSSDKIVYSWPDSPYKFEIHTDGGFAGLIAIAPVTNGQQVEMKPQRIINSKPYVISAVPENVELGRDQHSLGRDPKASLQFGVFGETPVFFTRTGLTLKIDKAVHPKNADLKIHFEGNKAILQYRDAGNQQRNFLFDQNHILEIPDFQIDGVVRKFQIDEASQVLVVNDKTVGPVTDLQEASFKAHLGIEATSLEKIQIPLKKSDSAKSTSDAHKLVLDAPRKAASNNGASDEAEGEAKLDQHWMESIEIAHEQGRKHISEVEAMAQQDGKTVRAFDVVKNFIQDLDVNYRKGDYVNEPEERQIEDTIITIMHNKEVGNVKYLGPGGVGKSTSLKNLAYRRRDDEKIGDFRESAFLELNVSAMNSSKYKGSEGASLNALISLAQAYAAAGQKLVLVVDEAHMMAGKEESNLTQALKPYTANGTIRMIAISTKAEWDQAFSQDVAWNSRFALVEKKEPQGERLTGMLKGWAKRFSYKAPTTEVIEMIAKLSNRFDPVGAQPRRGIRLLDTIYSNLKVQKQDRAPTLEDVYSVASSFYNADPAEFNEETRKARVAQLQQAMDQVVGQEVAKEEIITNEAISVTGSGAEGKMQRLLLAGAKGNGHSTLVKILADMTKKNLTEIDLSQFSDGSALPRLQQAMAKAVQKSAIGIIYFTNAEYAGGPVQLMLNDVLKTGRMDVMMDRNIQEFNLKNITMILSTYNGSEYLDKLASPNDFSASDFRASVGDGFYPPLLAEFDIAPIMPLKGDEAKALVGRIVDETLGSISSREKNRAVKIDHRDEYVNKLIEKSGQKIDGSAIRNTVISEISKAVAVSKLSSNQGPLEISFKDGKLQSPHKMDALKCALALGKK